MSESKLTTTDATDAPGSSEFVRPTLNHGNSLHQRLWTLPVEVVDEILTLVSGDDDLTGTALSECRAKKLGRIRKTSTQFNAFITTYMAGSLWYVSFIVRSRGDFATQWNNEHSKRIRQYASVLVIDAHTWHSEEYEEVVVDMTTGDYRHLKEVRALLTSIKPPSSCRWITDVATQIQKFRAQQEDYEQAYSKVETFYLNFEHWERHNDAKHLQMLTANMTEIISTFRSLRTLVKCNFMGKQVYLTQAPVSLTQNELKAWLDLHGTDVNSSVIIVPDPTYKRFKVEDFEQARNTCVASFLKDKQPHKSHLTTTITEESLRARILIERSFPTISFDRKEFHWLDCPPRCSCRD